MMNIIDGFKYFPSSCFFTNSSDFFQLFPSFYAMCQVVLTRLSLVTIYILISHHYCFKEILHLYFYFAHFVNGYVKDLCFLKGSGQDGKK